MPELLFAAVVVVLVLRSGPRHPPTYTEIPGRGRAWTTPRTAQRKHLAHFGWGRRKK